MGKGKKKKALNLEKIDYIHRAGVSKGRQYYKIYMKMDINWGFHVLRGML